MTDLLASSKTESSEPSRPQSFIAKTSEQFVFSMLHLIADSAVEGVDCVERVVSRVDDLGRRYMAMKDAMMNQREKFCVEI